MEDKLFSIKERLDNTESCLDDENITEKKKDKIFKKTLNYILKKMSRSIASIITLNIESMGQYTNLLINLTNFENNLIALLKNENSEISEKKKIIKKLNSKLLLPLTKNVHELSDAYQKLETKKLSLYSQHSKEIVSSSSLKDSQDFLNKTFFGGDEE